MSNRRNSGERHIFGRHLAVGMKLLDAGGNPRQILEISGYLEDDHPEIPDFRVATCQPDLSVVVYDRAVFRVAVERPADSDRPIRRED